MCVSPFEFDLSEHTKEQQGPFKAVARMRCASVSAPTLTSRYHDDVSQRENDARQALQCARGPRHLDLGGCAVLCEQVTRGLINPIKKRRGVDKPRVRILMSKDGDDESRSSALQASEQEKDDTTLNAS
jgi:hypothetical protein